MQLSDADLAQLDDWWRACLGQVDVLRAGPLPAGGLPAGVVPVQTRWLRAVGRGVLPDLGPVYLKVMTFPRRRDRVRYALRALPAVHEARMIEVVHGAGVPCPHVVLARGLRSLGLPKLSLLVTRALPATGEAPTDSALAATAVQLAAAGVWHPDLHSGNFLRLDCGATAVLDLQSARLRRPGLDRASRLQMAAKLLAERPEASAALVAAGLVDGAAASDAARRAGRLRSAALERRIARCMRRSTEFTVRRGWRGTTFRRRGCPTGGSWCDGGKELLDLWIGDRALQVLDGREPVLGALFRKSWWLRGRHSVYIRPASREVVLPGEVPALLEGFERFRELSRAGSLRERDRAP